MTGVVFAWSCRPCAASQGVTGDEYAPGRYALGPIHIEHVPDLVALGWDVTTYAGEPPDVYCPHYRALCASDPED